MASNKSHIVTYIIILVLFVFSLIIFEGSGYVLIAFLTYAMLTFGFFINLIQSMLCLKSKGIKFYILSVVTIIFCLLFIYIIYLTQDMGTGLPPAIDLFNNELNID